MTAYVTFYPLGNADSTLLELADKQLLLIDYGNQRNPDDPYDKRCDLAKELRAALRKRDRRVSGRFVSRTSTMTIASGWANSSGSSTRPLTREVTASRSTRCGFLPAR